METRQKFEALPEIATHLNHGNVFFNEENKTYASEFSSLHIVACYVNGAWMMFQEQQRKLDVVLNTILWHIEDCDLVEDREYNSAWRESMIFMQQELLK